MDKIGYNLQGEPFFRYKNKRYYLDNFLRVHYPFIDTMIITDTINALQSKEIIQLAGYESDIYYKPLFLEIGDSGENVRLYRYIGTNKE